ncbi:MAG: hypothetical protein HS100_20620 [Anaerolineales bacterium]|nr:hypothetical protein [Anaerolineales bacterium]
MSISQANQGEVPADMPIAQPNQGEVLSPAHRHPFSICYTRCAPALSKWLCLL